MKTLLLLPLLLAPAPQGSALTHDPPVSVREASTGVDGILYARPFRLQRAYEHAWRAEQPRVSTGWLLVLEVDSQLVVPRQLAEPVLYVGAETAERVNTGAGSGRLVVLVPSAAGEDGGPVLDLAAAPIWFGPPDLPERVTAAAAGAELQRARAAGVAAFPGPRVLAARQRGGPRLELADYGALRRFAARLILRWAPDEAELARGILVPPVR